MKVKKDDSKDKKKKSKIQQVASSGIKKQKKTKKVKVESNTEVGEAIKKELTENVAVVPNKMPLRQEKWRSFLQVFLQHEKLNKKQKLIITFCTTKGVTAPRRKKKFLNFIRNCYNHQSDVTDEQVFELFDIILLKYDEFKSGNYHNTDPNNLVVPELKPKLGKNKKKKLKRVIAAKANSSTNNDKDAEDKKWKKVERKKKKSKASIKAEENEDESNVKMESDD